jgi:hypothetical protein
MANIERGEWTIMLGEDGPDFAVEGHGIEAFPELDRIEVVDAATHRGAVGLLREVHDLLAPADVDDPSAVPLAVDKLAAYLDGGQ